MEQEEYYPLKLWLLFVATLRSISVFGGYLRPTLLHNAVTSLDWPAESDGDGDQRLTKMYAELYTRTFAIWTLLSCIICIFTAFNLHSRPLIYVALSSFYVVAVYFVVELFIFHSNVGEIISCCICCIHCSCRCCIISYKYRAVVLDCVFVRSSPGVISGGKYLPRE